MSVVKGWCPGALRPMESGDGLVVRIRPRGGRLTQVQTAGIARAATQHGSGLIDLTGRANLQLRGVTPDSHPALIADLATLGLIDADIAAETRRNVTVTPFADAETDALAAGLEATLAASDLALPAKFGFAVDTGPQPVLTDTPADIRLERSETGRLILRADGAALGTPVEGPTQALLLAEWFLNNREATEKRMAALIARKGPPGGALPPAPPLSRPDPGPTSQGLLVAIEFGRIEADTLATLARIAPLRLTPWRMLLIESATDWPDLPGLIHDPTDPRLRLRACPGAPACPQALAPTRPLARDLAPRLPNDAILHVSGCAKGCGWPHPADITLTATPLGFDLIRNGRASDRPEQRGLAPAQLPEVL